jgi:hypothetical protein
VARIGQSSPRNTTEDVGISGEGELSDRHPGERLGQELYLTTNPSNANDADAATGQAPVARLSMVNMDCADPQPLAAFYAHILGWQVTYSDNDYAMITGEGATRVYGEQRDDSTRSWQGTTCHM